LINEEKTVCLHRSVPEPTHRFDLFHYVASCWPILYGVSPPGRNQSLRQRRPGIFITNRAVTSALANLPRTIPIDKRHCFTQRFSPTGFNLNALDSNWCHPIASARIQVKTYPFSSILQGTLRWSGRNNPPIVREISRRGGRLGGRLDIDKFLRYLMDICSWLAPFEGNMSQPTTLEEANRHGF
jgi:hypothetical protein